MLTGTPDTIKMHRNKTCVERSAVIVNDIISLTSENWKIDEN